MISLTELARRAVEVFVTKQRTIEPPADIKKAFLQEKAGVFVTIEKKDQLRGCIGTYLPTRENIAREVIDNAIEAATRDWRFGPVQEQELADLKYSVYILSRPEPVEDLAHLDPQKYGILIKSQTRSGLLLPAIAGITTVEQQLSAVCQKAGIAPSREKFSLFRFTVKKYEE